MGLEAIQTYHASGGRAYGQVGGRWHPLPTYEDKPVPKKKRSGRKLGVVVDGTFFDSVVAAAQNMGIAPSTLSSALSKGRATCKGHKVAYAPESSVSTKELICA